MKAIRATKLLGLPVRLHGIQLGRPTELLLDVDGLRALGLDLVCGDQVHRFLPLPTAVISETQIEIRSPLVLLEEDELAFYRARSFTLRSLRGRPVEQDGRAIGMLEDVVVDSTGPVTELVVDADGEEQRVPFGPGVRVAPGSRSAA